jgi:DNA-3-methyladenine glycosylase II
VELVEMAQARLSVRGPYDLELSLRAMASFSPDPPQGALAVMRVPARLDGHPAAIEIRQVRRKPPELVASSPDIRRWRAVRDAAEWVINAQLDLVPFYRMVAADRVLGPIASRYRGLKPVRPASLFEMAVIAVTEQQISLAAGQRIRARVVERFGERAHGLWFFPRPDALARASLETLRGCGLSGRKAEYIRDLARSVTNGSIDLEALKRSPDDEVRAVVNGIRGFGRWSTDYILIRGLGRVDVVPADDLGIRTIVGGYFGRNRRLSADEVRSVLGRYAPYRGIAVFYLLVHRRLSFAAQLSLQNPKGR